MPHTHYTDTDILRLAILGAQSELAKLNGIIADCEMLLHSKPRVSKRVAKKPPPKSGWSADPAERKREMARRRAKARRNREAAESKAATPVRKAAVWTPARRRKMARVARERWAAGGSAAFASKAKSPVPQVKLA